VKYKYNTIPRERERQRERANLFLNLFIVFICICFVVLCIEKYDELYTGIFVLLLMIGSLLTLLLLGSALLLGIKIYKYYETYDTSRSTSPLPSTLMTGTY